MGVLCLYKGRMGIGVRMGRVVEHGDIYENTVGRWDLMGSNGIIWHPCRGLSRVIIMELSIRPL